MSDASTHNCNILQQSWRTLSACIILSPSTCAKPWRSLCAASVGQQRNPAHFVLLPEAVPGGRLQQPCLLVVICSTLVSLGLQLCAAAGGISTWTTTARTPQHRGPMRTHQSRCCKPDQAERLCACGDGCCTWTHLHQPWRLERHTHSSLLHCIVVRG